MTQQRVNKGTVNGSPQSPGRRVRAQEEGFWEEVAGNQALGECGVLRRTIIPGTPPLRDAVLVPVPWIWAGL